MKICVTIFNNSLDSHICNFINSINNFDFFFKKLEAIDDKTNVLTLIILTNQSQRNQTKILKKLLKHINSNFIFLIPSSWDRNSIMTHNKIINYPIKISDFEKSLLKYANNISASFENFILNNQNLLFANKQKHIYLTEPEAHIIKLLFESKKVSKARIKKEVLKLKSEVESKSLETHLYRLRKKLSLLSPNILIKSDDNNNLVIEKN